MSSTPISRKYLATAVDELSRKEYSDEVGWGFVDVQNEGDTFTGTFVERFETEDQVAHPFGEITAYRRVHYSQVKFRLGLKAPQLEVFDGPRSFTPLVTELARCFGFGLAFFPVRIDLKALIKALQQKTSSLTLLGASLGNIPLASDVFARVSVFGAGEVGPYLSMAAFGKPLVLEKICLAGTFRVGGFKIDVSSDARMQIHSGQGDILLRTLRGVIIKSIQ